MRIPVKVTPDRIRDSIVQVFFQTEVPFEPLIGFFYNALIGSEWRYINRQSQPPIQPGLGFEISSPSQHFFTKDRVKIQVLPNHSIVFNCINNYIGWADYSRAIYSALDTVFKSGYIKSFNRVGMRYVSEFANVDILEHINLSVEIEGFTGKMASSAFRVTYDENNISKTINIASKLPVNAVLPNSDELINFVSLIDIDIIKKELDISDMQKLFGIIEELHTSEKEVFFGLLKEQFLQTLNPEYS